jgi:hypothetical protein
MMSAIRSAADPGKACLDLMVRWQLQRMGVPANRIAEKKGTA